MNAPPPAAVLADRPPEKTLAERALKLLREEVLAGRLAPGARLRPNELQRRYGLGLSPIREALTRLSSEGLVVAEGQRGFAVGAVSLAELEDLSRTREHIESLVLTDAIARGDAAWEAGIVAAFHLLSRTPIPRDPADGAAAARWEASHRAFHQALVSACSSPWQLRFHAQLVDHSERYRRVRLFHGTRPRQLARDVEAEHRAIMEAVLAKDTKRATGLMTEHLRRTTALVAEAWQAPAASKSRAKRSARG